MALRASGQVNSVGQYNPRKGCSMRCKLLVLVATFWFFFVYGSSGTRAEAATLLSDDFNSGTTMSSANYKLPAVSSSDTFIMRTQFHNFSFGDSLPAVSGGSALVTLDTWNPHAAGELFFGTDVISVQSFDEGAGLVITVRAKMDPNAPPGTVFGIFPYSLDAGSNTLHCEIDWEFITNYISWVQTNIYGHEPLGAGHTVQIKFPNGGTMNDWHTYQIIWLPGQVTWVLDGVPVRTTTTQSPLPTGSMYLHFNVWVPGAGWVYAYNQNLQPATSVGENKTYTMSIDSVNVQTISTSASAKIAIGPTAVSCLTGGVKQQMFSVVSDASSIPTGTQQVTWTIDDSSIADVDANGVVTPKSKVGTANIKAKIGAVTSNVSVVTVSYAPPDNPGVVIDNCSEYGVLDGSVEGHVTGINPQNYSGYGIVVYIYAPGWWPKPYFGALVSPINSDGTYNVDITTGTGDQNATKVAVFVVPSDFVPPDSGGLTDIPTTVTAYPSVYLDRPVVVPVLTSISITSSNPSMVMALNYTYTINVLGLDQNGYVIDGIVFTFVSDNTSVANVNSSTGALTTVSWGTANITVSSGGKSAVLYLTVKDPDAPFAGGLKLTLPTTTFTVGDAPGKVTVQIVDQNGAVMSGATLPGPIKWYCADPTVAPVSLVGSDWFVTPLSKGTSSLGAASGSLSSNLLNIVVNSKVVDPPVLTTITLLPTTIQLVVGEVTTQLRIMTYDQFGNYIFATVTWESDNPNIASVDSALGYVTGVSVGTVNIIAKAGLVVSNSSVVVVNPVPIVLTSISVTPATATLTVGGEGIQLSANATDQFGNPFLTTFFWSSDNINVAVNGNGLVTPLLGGTSYVYAASGNVYGNAVITVETPIPIPVLTTLSLTPLTFTFVVGGASKSLVLVGYDQNGDVIAVLGSEISYFTDDSSVADVDRSGRVFPGIVGITQVFVTVGTVTSNSVTVTVNPAVVPVTHGIKNFQVPKLGHSGYATGKVFGLKPAQYPRYRVLVYIQVAGLWYTKPYYNASATSIGRDGRWKANVTTGIHDRSAKRIRAYLVPRSVKPLSRGDVDLSWKLDPYPFVERVR